MEDNITPLLVRQAYINLESLILYGRYSYDELKIYWKAIDELFNDKSGYELIESYANGFRQS